MTPRPHRPRASTAPLAHATAAAGALALAALAGVAAAAATEPPVTPPVVETPLAAATSIPPAVDGTRAAETAAVERELAAMGTALRLRVEARDRAAALRASEAAIAALTAVEARLSTWRDDSELARLNATAPGEPVALSAATAAELAAAARCGRATEGAFEPAVGRLVDLWDLRGAGRVPEPGELAAALPASRATAWRIDDTRAARLHSATRLEEGGFGKGAGLDRAIAALAAAPGVAAAWLDLGGQTALLGAEPWAVRVAHPDHRARPAVELLAAGGSVATSGNGERGRRVGGRLVGHLLDPRTGEPARDFGSLTVWAPSALLADCLATGLFVLGPEAALAWAAEHPEVQVLALVREGGGGSATGALTARASAGLAGRLRALAPEVTIVFEEGRAAQAASGGNAGATGRLLTEGGPAAP